MEALTIIPKQKGSLNIKSVEEPKIKGNEVLCKTANIGVCGTDFEISGGLYGEAPPKSKYLVIGHEALALIKEAGNVINLKKGDHVVPVVRRPGSCSNCRSGQYDMCIDNNYSERGIRGMHGFASEYFVESEDFLVKVDESIIDIAILTEPLSIVEKCISQAYKVQQRIEWKPKKALVLGTGPIGMLAAFVLRGKGLRVMAVDRSGEDTTQASILEEIGAIHINSKEKPISQLGKENSFDLIVEATGSEKVIADALSIIGINGVLVLQSITSNKESLELNISKLNLDIVLNNKLIIGSVSSNKRHFEMALNDLQVFNKKWAGAIRSLITKRLSLLDYKKAFEQKGIKTVIEFGNGT